MDWKKLLSTKRQAQPETDSEKWADYPISEFEKDYKSIISSAAFRRLQDKTQVFPLDKSDFVRTRLTHSIEVSAIAKQLGIMITQNKTNYLRPDFNINDNADSNEQEERLKIISGIPAILSCAGLLHDLGNPPFGHFGEVVIRDWFKNEFKKESFCYKGSPVKNVLSKRQQNDLCNFEGNAQAFRILSKINHNPDGYDANLSYGVINALIKYPTNSNNINADCADVRLHKLGYFFSEEALFHDVCTETGTKLATGSYARHPLAFLVEAADDIAYATADLEDAIKKGLFTVDQFIDYFEKEISKLPDNKKKRMTKGLLSNLKKRLDSLPNRSKENDLVAFQKWTVYVKGWLMYVVAFSFSKNYDRIMDGSYCRDMFADGFHEYSLKILEDAMAEFVFDAPEILKLELSAQKIICSLLDDFVYAVLHWDVKDDNYKLTKAQKKFVNIISANYKRDYENSRGNDEAQNLYLRFLMVTDFISGMTDSYAKNLYQELNGII